MHSSVNLAAFRNNIGHDSTMEAMLLRMFIECADEVFGKLQMAARQTTPSEEWNQQLHLLKGAALNISALPLAELAEALQTDMPYLMQSYLPQLDAAYADVRHAILSRLAEI